MDFKAANSKTILYCRQWYVDLRVEIRKLDLLFKIKFDFLFSGKFKRRLLVKQVWIFIMVSKYNLFNPGNWETEGVRISDFLGVSEYKILFTCSQLLQILVKNYTLYALAKFKNTEQLL